MSTALLRKEARALLPMWGAAILLILVGGRWDREYAAVGYLLGSLVIGGQVFGHEYTHRTLAMLLTQPIGRHRVYVTKMTVLALGLATISVAAYFGLLRDARALPSTPAGILTAIGLTAFTLGPVMTFLGRGPIAGSLFDQDDGVAGVGGLHDQPADVHAARFQLAAHASGMCVASHGAKV